MRTLRMNGSRKRFTAYDTQSFYFIKWKDQIGWFILDLLLEIPRKMAENRIKPEEFQDRIVFMTMYNDIDWTKEEEHLKKCVSNSMEVKA